MSMFGDKDKMPDVCTPLGDQVLLYYRNSVSDDFHWTFMHMTESIRAC